MQVKLKVMRGSSAGKEIRIPGEKFRIGRADSCQLRPKSDSVSRKHCEIAIRDDKVFVRDLGSRNGTHVNDEKLEPKVECELQLGNILRVGKLEFEIVLAHGLDAGKRGKISDVKSAAARTKEAAAPKAGDVTIDEDISGWLEEGASDAAVSSPETRQYKMGDTDRIALEKAKAEAAEGEESSDSSGSEDDEGSGAWFRRKSKEYGKLPDRPKQQTDSSGDAAADMLKKFFNRS